MLSNIYKAYLIKSNLIPLKTYRPIFRFTHLLNKGLLSLIFFYIWAIYIASFIKLSVLAKKIVLYRFSIYFLIVARDFYILIIA